ncbi:FkbM family methyltransferase [Okeanomitos corallinicola TIOX110]|uniref:FkbM family methyltransferase n=1 Tax=Okeanomitos corallinicola TIOX110 TaxID=3133117 RepID=A0ABZ2UW36_9CYAN
MKLEKTLLNLCPKYLRLPVKYHYHQIRNRLEKEIFYLQHLEINKKRSIDIGANSGLYTYALSHLSNVVEVFEPQTWCTEDIVSYTKISPANINIYNVGLADFHGSLNLHIPVSEGDYSQLVKDVGNLTTGLGSFRQIEGEQKTVEVPVHKLDDYDFQDVGFMKIDVEGFESKVILGASQTIFREKPIILIEVENRHLEGKSITDVFEQISDFGYEGGFIHEGSFHKLADFYPQIQAKQNYFLDDQSHQKQPIYINNFLFIPLL